MRGLGACNPGTGVNFAGLFIVDLPPGVISGQTYTITVRRISTHPAAAAPPPPPPQIGAASRPAATTDKAMRAWRYVVGTFAVRIPVTTLAIMTWRRSQMDPTNRWIPVLNRFIGLIEGRIRGLGGNPGAIEPSPWGAHAAP
jgi:hypothetical protein